jgi:hypothetical protein
MDCARLAGLSRHSAKRDGRRFREDFADATALRACFENGSGGETPPKLAGQRPALRSAGVRACELERRLAARIMDTHHIQDTL